MDERTLEFCRVVLNKRLPATLKAKGTATRWYKGGHQKLRAGIVVVILPNHLTLGQLIKVLEKESDQDRVLKIGFHHPHSYRGDYYELAFEVRADVTIAEMLASAKSARGTTFEGWKGGDFTMTEHTHVWLVVEEGSGQGETLGALLLSLMLK